MGCGASTNAQLLPHPKADTKYGPVEGKRHLLRDNRVVNIFLGIPFAQPPIGNLRLKRPVPPEAWSHTLQCKYYKKRPMQTNFVWDIRRTGKGVSEDCLYLNIMAPAWTNKDFKNGFPVFLYVHGGGYVLDSAAGYKYKDLSKQLVSKEVVAVTIEYRLGYLGFFCLDDKHCKGNFGMWDQAMGLQFVKDNIAQFGGDPEKITVCGQSAGGTSTDLLSISPITRHLFHQKICMAGSAENQWSMSEKEWVIKACRKHALDVGFERRSEAEEWTDQENEECMEYLRKIPASKLIFKVYKEGYFLFKNQRLTITPVMDGEFLPKPPGPLRRECPAMPTIIGVTKYEALIFLFLANQRANQKLLAYGENVFNSMCKELKGKVDESEMMSLQTFRDMYGINEMMKKDKKALGKTLVKLVGDLVNNIATHNYCLKAANSSAPCWRYVMEQFQPAQTRMFNPFFPINGATHCTDLTYLFDFNFFQHPWIKRATDRKIQHMFSTYFTNFVKFGDPNICSMNDKGGTTSSDLVFWEKITPEKPERQMFFRAEPFMGDNPDRKRLDRLCAMLNYFTDHLGFVLNK